MIREELEFRIARYADGDLSVAERLAVEAELSADAEARALLAEYQTLRTVIEEAAGPALPKVHWDRLEQLLSTAVARAAPGTATANEVPGHSGDGPFAGALGIENEFAIACLADGTLAPERQAEVEQLLVSDPRCRALFDVYHNVDAVTKASAYNDALPPVRWDRLAGQISRVVDSGANARLPEDIERQIAAFVEGALPDGECDEIESRLAGDPGARVLASEYRHLDAALQTIWSADAVPTVDWERFAGRISAAIDEEAVQTAAGLRKLQQGAYAVLKWLRSPTRMALAASVLIGVALVSRLMHGPGPGPGPIHPGFVATHPTVEEIATLQPEAAAGPSQSEIAIGPPAVARSGVDDDYAEGTSDDDVVSHPPARVRRQRQVHATGIGCVAGNAVLVFD